MKGVSAFFASMTGRTFLLLVLGMACAAMLATWISQGLSRHQFEEQTVAHIAARLVAFVEKLDDSPMPSRQKLLADGSPGILQQQADVSSGVTDDNFARLLASRSAVFTHVVVKFAPWAVCFPNQRDAPAGPQLWHSPSEMSPNVVLPTCRLVSLLLTDGTPVRLSVDTPFAFRQESWLLTPVYLLLLSIGIAILAYGVTQLTVLPLRGLSKAAAELGEDLDRAPIPVRGPTETRLAAQAFNAMQCRLQEHVTERTQMLAAITHDLQTPLTRLRLRMEKVEDEELRERLVSDLAAMKALVNEGLDLARSADAAEERVMLDLDSLLESLVEDACDAGSRVAFKNGCGCVLRLRPLAVTRLFSNLIDNALQHAGSAIVSSFSTEAHVWVSIRDAGPGIPEAMLEPVFQPFVRLESSRSRESGGSGLGLTIARNLARKNGATVVLRNHPEGGLEATVCWSIPQAATFL
jgi:signal transduction histidine kinase